MFLETHVNSDDETLRIVFYTISDLERTRHEFVSADSPQHDNCFRDARYR